MPSRWTFVTVTRVFAISFHRMMIWRPARSGCSTAAAVREGETDRRASVVS
jgi:hypothetical protein